MVPCFATIGLLILAAESSNDAMREFPLHLCEFHRPSLQWFWIEPSEVDPEAFAAMKKDDGSIVLLIATPYSTREPMKPGTLADFEIKYFSKTKATRISSREHVQDNVPAIDIAANNANGQGQHLRAIFANSRIYQIVLLTPQPAPNSSVDPDEVFWKFLFTSPPNPKPADQSKDEYYKDHRAFFALMYLGVVAVFVLVTFLMLFKLNHRPRYQ